MAELRTLRRDEEATGLESTSTFIHAFRSHVAWAESQARAQDVFYVRCAPGNRSHLAKFISQSTMAERSNGYSYVGRNDLPEVPELYEASARRPSWAPW